jgi:CHAT domain-containing protein
LGLGVRSLLVVCLLALGLRVGSPASAQPPTQTDGELQIAAKLLLIDARSLYTGDQFAESLASSLEAETIYRQISDSEGLSSSLYWIGSNQWSLGRYDEALPTLLEARELAVALENEELEYQALLPLSGVHFDIGQLDEAISTMERNVSIARGHQDWPTNDTVQGLVVLGSYYSLSGNSSRAHELYSEAIELMEKSGVRGQEGNILLDIGNNYGNVGQFDTAVDYWTQAREAFKQTDIADQAYWERATITMLMTGYTVLERWDEALALKEDGLRLASGDRYEEGQILVRVADAYRHRGVARDSSADLEAAIEYYLEVDAIASEIRDREPGRYGQLRHDVLSGIGSVQVRQGKYAIALANLEEAFALEEEFGLPQDPGLLRDIGYAHESLGHPDALQFYMDSIKVGEEKRSASTLEAFRWKIPELYAKSYDRAVMLSFRLGQHSDAFDFAEGARARTFIDLMGSRRPDVREAGDDELAERERELRAERASLEQLIRKEQEKSATTLNKGRLNELNAQLDAKEREYEKALTDLEVADSEYHALVTADPLTLPEVQAHLDNETTLLSYFVTDEETLVFVVTRDQLETVRLRDGVDKSGLEQAVKAFRDTNEVPSDATEELKALYAMLVEPVLSAIRTTRVGIIPHGVLHYLPFAALTDGTTFFGDSRSVFYLPSASALPFVKKAAEQATQGNAMVMSYGLDEGAEEAKTIARLFHVKPLLGDDAAESRVRTDASEAGIIHIAAHGRFDPENPLFSRIELADDPLEVHEVYELDLRGTGMVALSACQTHLGEVSGGDDVVGLTRAFIYAGTPTVIASLWKVPDAATRVFMEYFYAELQRGATKGEALQLAQQQAREDYLTPYYWAGFVLTGDDGQISVEPGPVTEGGGSWALLVGSVTAVVLCAAAALWFTRRMWLAKLPQ